MSGVDDLGFRFGGLSNKTQIDLIYHHLNIKKKSS